MDSLNGLIQLALSKYKRDGLVSFIITSWFFCFQFFEDIIGRISYTKRLSWLMVQLQWMPFLSVIYPISNGWVCMNILTGRKFYFPKLAHHSRARKEYPLRLRRIYSSPDFVEVSDGDVVFDVGAFLGGYALSVADEARSVIAIEPNHLSAQFANLNTPDNVTVVPIAAWKSSGRMDLQLGKEESQDSLIEPDDEGSGEIVDVSVNTIENICELLEIDHIDFLKVETEGTEPEVLEGLGNISVEKIVVNAGAERFGENVVDDVLDYFENHGYSARVDGTIIFGLRSSSHK